MNTSNLLHLSIHDHSGDCAGIFKSEYCDWDPSRIVQAEKLVVNCTAFFKKQHAQQNEVFQQNNV